MASQDMSPFPAADGYDTAFPNPLKPTCQELYTNLESEPHDPNEQPATEGPPTPTKQFSVSGSEYLSLLTTDHTDEDNSYMGLAYKPSLPPLPPPPIQSPPIQPTAPTLQHPLPPMQSLLPHVQSPPSVAKKQTHSSLAQRAQQSLDPAQVDIMIQMLEKLKGEPGTTVVPQPPSLLPKKKDDRLYEDMDSLDISSETVTVFLVLLSLQTGHCLGNKNFLTNLSKQIHSECSLHIRSMLRKATLVGLCMLCEVLECCSMQLFA